MIEIKGKANIIARVIADSISEQGNRLTTWEVEYPRLIHAELMTHRMFSRNAASSRAIPFAKMLEQLKGRPVRFGANQAGMQDKGEDYTAPISMDVYIEGEGWSVDNYETGEAWERSRDFAVACAGAFAKAGYHKQITGRLTEPFQMMKTIISATEVDNFFWLRDDDAADPSIAELAHCMKQAYDESVPELLKAGEYHLPYIDIWYDKVAGLRGHSINVNGEPKTISRDDAIKVSCARCAAVSYRNEGYGVEKSVDVFNKLLGSDKKHASAFEHVATPMLKKYTVLYQDSAGGEYANDPESSRTWQDGVSHVDRESNLWSGNFKGWVQYRKTIPGENYVAQK